MAARTKRTIDPKKVVNLDSWLQYYKSGYKNVILDGGRYLVLDPAQYKTDYAAALASPAKIIPSLKAIDAYTASTKHPQLRAAAETVMSTVYEERRKQVADATKAVNDAETEVLTATLAWNGSENSTRSILSLTVARATQMMENAEAALAAAKYPVRYIKAETGLLRKDLDYATHDDRKINNELYRIVVEPTRLNQRIIPFIEGGKA